MPDTDRTAAALAAFRAARAAAPPDGVPPERLRLNALALSLGEWTKALVAAVRVVAGAPIGPDTTPPAARPGPLWFAHESTPRLWWQRLREHLTPRSVYFQGALRLAAALATARLLAGVLDLSHGFWVLLTILTLLRASAAETRSLLWPALVGTLVGSVLAAALLVADIPPTVFAVVLPLVMLVGFAAGPLLGLGWGQALFTVVIALVFAQVSPVDWTLAAVRVLDVAVGAAIGLATGLLAWPRGGSGELHRAAGAYLAAAARVVRETVDVLARGARPGTALPEARDGRRARLGLVGAVPDRAPPAGVGRLAGHAARRAPRRPRGRGRAKGVSDRTAAALRGGAHRRVGRRRGPVRPGRRRPRSARPVRPDRATARPASQRLAHEPRRRPVPPRRPARLARRAARRPRPHPVDRRVPANRPDSAGGPA